MKNKKKSLVCMLAMSSLVLPNVSNAIYEVNRVHGKEVNEQKMFYLKEKNKDREGKIRIPYEKAGTEYKVEEKFVTKVIMYTLPSKYTYKVGEKFDPKGLEIEVNYSDLQNEVLNYEQVKDKVKIYVLRGSDYLAIESTELKETDKEICVVYEDSKDDSNKNFKFPIEVKNVVDSISISKAPTKTNYIVGETFEKSGVVITLRYTDGSTKEVRDNFEAEGITFNIKDNHLMTKADTSLIATYNKNSINISSASTDLNIVDPTVQPDNDANGNKVDDTEEVNNIKRLVEEAKSAKEDFENAKKGLGGDGVIPAYSDEDLNELKGLKTVYESAKTKALAEKEKANGANGIDSVDITELVDVKLPEVNDKDKNNIVDFTPEIEKLEKEYYQLINSIPQDIKDFGGIKDKLREIENELEKVPESDGKNILLKTMEHFKVSMAIKEAEVAMEEAQKVLDEAKKEPEITQVEKDAVITANKKVEEAKKKAQALIDALKQDNIKQSLQETLNKVNTVQVPDVTNSNKPVLQKIEIVKYKNEDISTSKQITVTEDDEFTTEGMEILLLFENNKTERISSDKFYEKGITFEILNGQKISTIENGYVFKVGDVQIVAKTNIVKSAGTKVVVNEKSEPKKETVSVVIYYKHNDETINTEFRFVELGTTFTLPEKIEGNGKEYKVIQDDKKIVISKDKVVNGRIKLEVAIEPISKDKPDNSGDTNPAPNPKTFNKLTIIYKHNGVVVKTETVDVKIGEKHILGNEINVGDKTYIIVQEEKSIKVENDKTIDVEVKLATNLIEIKPADPVIPNNPDNGGSAPAPTVHKLIIIYKHNGVVVKTETVDVKIGEKHILGNEINVGDKTYIIVQEEKTVEVEKDKTIDVEVKLATGLTEIKPVDPVVPEKEEQSTPDNQGQNKGNVVIEVEEIEEEVPNNSNSRNTGNVQNTENALSPKANVNNQNGNSTAVVNNSQKEQKAEKKEVKEYNVTLKYKFSNDFVKTETVKVKAGEAYKLSDEIVVDGVKYRVLGDKTVKTDTEKTVEISVEKVEKTAEKKEAKEEKKEKVVQKKRNIIPILIGVISAIALGIFVAGKKRNK